MDKLKLDVEDLRVDSFTAAERSQGKGTVAGHASGHPDCTSVYLCTLQTCGLPVCTAAG